MIEEKDSKKEFYKTQVRNLEEQLAQSDLYIEGLEQELLLAKMCNASFSEKVNDTLCDKHCNLINISS
jgi:hypothetical protein